MQGVESKVNSIKMQANDEKYYDETSKTFDYVRVPSSNKQI